MSAPPPATTIRARAGGADEGRVLLLTLGFVVLGLMLVAMAVSATAVHLDHKRLYNLADLLAVRAADATPIGHHLVAGTSGTPDGWIVLADADVVRAVDAELAAYPFPEQLPGGLRVLRADSPDGRSARVALTATSHPPLLSWFTRTFDHGFDITVTSTARTVTGWP